MQTGQAGLKEDVLSVNLHRKNVRALRWWLLAMLVFSMVRPGYGYSVLSHEEVVDQAWLPYLRPLIEQRYPGLTAEQIRECHAYAYGGSVIQDIGYYPFGDKEFSDLLHYARSGEFVAALLRDATTPDEFAFALGALAHYYGDTIGHPVVNVIVGEEYPKLRNHFGRIVTYGDNETAHLRTEFGFDVVEVAHGAYSQENYRDFVGFQVSKDVLARAFLETYGMPIDDVLTHEDLAISTYRYSISTLIPKMTKVALAGYGKQIQHANPSFAKKEFIYRLRRTEFEKQYGRQYTHASFGERFVAFLLNLVPKVGPFSALSLHLPDADQQDQFLSSFDHVETAYRAEITRVAESPADKPPTPPELDFDTGRPTNEGEYKLADESYAWLVEHLASDGHAQVRPALLADLDHFYRDPQANDALKDKPKDWLKLQDSLAKVRTAPLVTTPVVSAAPAEPAPAVAHP